MLRESASLREETERKREIPVSVDGEGTVRLLHREEKAIDVRAVDGAVGTNDRESVHSGIGDHCVGILRKDEEKNWKDTSR